MNCILCGKPMPTDTRSWWKRAWSPPGMPVHPTWPGVSEDDKDACWADYNARMGVAAPGPRPGAR